MEVTGLVLGVYPVVILAFEQFKTGAEYFSNWRQFRRHYEGFIRDIEAQQLFLEGTLQDLLCGGLDPYLFGNSSKEAFLRMVSDSSYAGWTDPKLTENLKSLLDKRYDWYMYTIKRIYEIFKELEDVLDIQAVIQSSNRTPDWWKYQWERIKQTLFMERYDKHKEATRLIGELKQMLALSDAQPRGKERAVPSVVPFLNRVRTNTYNLHEALKSAWHCHCSSAHKAMLQLERQDQERESDFNVLFVLRKHEKQGFDMSRDTETEVIHCCIEREVSVKILPDEIKQKRSEGIIENATSTVILSSSAGGPRTPSSLSSTNNSETHLSPPIRPIARSTKSQGSFYSAASSDTSAPKFFHGLKLRWGSKLRSSRSDQVTTVSANDTKVFFSSESNSLSSISTKRRRSITSTNNQQIKTLSIKEETGGGSCVTESVLLLDDRAGVIEANEKGATARTDTTIASSRNANITEASKSTESISPELREISDLCTIIRQSTVNAHLDYILDLKKKHFRFFLGPKAVREKESSISLQELLEYEPRLFPPMKRILVATILASSLVQLQRTQWIKDDWSKRDIFFRTRNGEVIFEQLYLSTEFASTGLPVTAVLALATDASRKHDANSDKDLTSINPSAMVDTLSAKTNPSITDPFSGAQPFYLKTFLECLGIVLIELCLGEPIERREDKVRVRPHGPTNGEPNHDFCLAIANAWTWEEINAYEPSFSDPIEMCLRFPNLGRAKQGRYDEILQDIYSAIVKPLQDEMNRRWQPGLDRTICF